MSTALSRELEDSPADPTFDLARRFLQSTQPGAEQLDRSDVDLLLRTAPPAHNEPAVFYVAVFAAIIMATSRRGLTSQAVGLAQGTVGRINDLSADEVQSASTQLPWLWLAIAEAYAGDGRMADAAQFWTLASRSGQDFPKFSALSWLSVLASLSAQMPATGAMLAEADRIRQAHDWNPEGAHRAPGLTARALVDAAFLNVDPLVEEADELVRVVAQTPQLVLIAKTIQVIAYRTAGRLDEAVEQFHGTFHGMDLTHARPMLLDAIGFTRMTLLLAEGHPGQVLRELEHVTSLPDHMVCFETLRAFGYLSLGMGHHALDALRPCVEMKDAHQVGTMPGVHFARASAFMSLGRTRPALEAFDLALTVGAEAGMREATLLPPVILGELIRGTEAAGRTVPPNVRHFVDHPANRLDRGYLALVGLSDRERRFLVAMRSQDTFDTIAAALFVSRNTLKAHSRRIYAKLGVLSRDAAVDVAESAGLFDVPEFGNDLG